MKKLLCLFLAITITLFSIPLSVTAQTNIYSDIIVGDVDVDKDRVVSIMDASTLQQYLAGMLEFDYMQKLSADTDGDAYVSIIDATVIQMYLAQLIEEFSGDSDAPYSYDSVGRMNNIHNIILYDTLGEDTYTLCYEDENGVMDAYSDICTIMVDDTDGFASYCGLIKQNSAPVNATCIGVYNSADERVGSISFPSDFSHSLGDKLYSFGAISDVHVGRNAYNNDIYPTSTDDFIRALTFFDTEENVDFTCVGGDLTIYATREELSYYKSIVDQYAGDMDIYVAAGNHEEYLAITNEYLHEYTGTPLYYYFTQGDDVFIMLGIASSFEKTTFVEGELQWLYEVLEENRNKRCFIFEHVLVDGGCGDAVGLHTGSKLKNHVTSVAFKSLLSHYKNTIHFHGHSHMEFALQQYNDNANYDNILGTHSVHIPSIAVPRSMTSEGKLATMFNQSEGYVIDVYENGVFLRGRDFVNQKLMPISQYYLDTTLKTIEPGTFVDTTGLIDTGITQ